MFARTDCFVSGVFAAVLRVSRFVGVAPLHFVKYKTGWRISPSSAWGIYGYFFFAINSTIGVFIRELLIDYSSFVNIWTNKRHVVDHVDSLFAMVIAGTAVYEAPKQMRLMIACLNHVEKVNCGLEAPQWPKRSEWKKKCLFFLWTITSVTLSCVDLALTTDLMNAIAWISVSYTLYYGFYWILVIRGIIFITITQHLLYSFRAVNARLRSLLHDEFRKPDSCEPETVRRLALLYTQACDVLQEIDRCHGLMLLMIMGFYFLHLVISPYYFFNMFENKSSLNNMAVDVVKVLVQLLWCIFHLVNLVIVIEPCHLTHREMEITRELVSRLMHRTHSFCDPLEVELELFFRQLILNKVSYSPLKVTTMSRSLVATILGTVTTYLVVIVQL